MSCVKTEREGVIYTGVPSREELKRCPGVPSRSRMEKGPVAVIECVQEIPCNPCESVCPVGAIHIGEQITSLPAIDEEKCTGCGLCVANCPGLAITVVNMNRDDGMVEIEFPFEYLPLPQERQEVEAVSRYGEVLCRGTVLKVKKLKAYANTAVVRIAVPREYADEVRSMKRLARQD